jgi:hypothetical protein
MSATEQQDMGCYIHRLVVLLIVEEPAVTMKCFKYYVSLRSELHGMMHFTITA